MFTSPHVSLLILFTMWIFWFQTLATKVWCWFTTKYRGERATRHNDTKTWHVLSLSTQEHTHTHTPSLTKCYVLSWWLKEISAQDCHSCLFHTGIPFLPPPLSFLHLTSTLLDSLWKLPLLSLLREFISLPLFWIICRIIAAVTSSFWRSPDDCSKILMTLFNIW